MKKIYLLFYVFVLSIHSMAQNMPFEVCLDGINDNTKWYYVKINNKYIGVDKQLKLFVSDRVKDANVDQYLWAFIDAGKESFYLTNRYLGNSYRLGSNSRSSMIHNGDLAVMKQGVGRKMHYKITKNGGAGIYTKNLFNTYLGTNNSLVGFVDSRVKADIIVEFVNSESNLDKAELTRIAKDTNSETKYKKDCPMKMIVKSPNVTLSKEEQNKEEFTTPEKAGYMFVTTKTIDGFKCDYYAEGVRTFHFGNGDFVTFPDGSEGRYQDFKPSKDDKSMGDWQLHAEDGGVVRKENGIVSITNPNGSIVKSSSNDNLSWGAKEKKPIVYRSWFKPDIVFLPNNDIPLKKVTFKNNEEYSLIRNKISSAFYALNVSGYMADNRVYYSNKEGDLIAFLQIVDGMPIPALETDSVIGIKTEIGKDRRGNEAIQLTINYANGDSIVCTNDHSDAFVVNSGTIHRNGGVLTIKTINNKQVKILTFPNNDKYVGEFNNDKAYPTDINANMASDYLCLYQLTWPELQYQNGTLIKANGKRIEFENGKTEQQIAAEKKAEEAKNTALYNNLCKKFGKRYVDAALNQRPIVGMPEELLKSAFNLKFVGQSGNYKQYRITGIGWKNFGTTLSDNVTLYTIWVRNGKIVDVKYWGN